MWHFNCSEGTLRAQKNGKKGLFPERMHFFDANKRENGKFDISCHEMPEKKVFSPQKSQLDLGRSHEQCTFFLWDCVHLALIVGQREIKTKVHPRYQENLEKIQTSFDHEKLFFSDISKSSCRLRVPILFRVPFSSSSNCSTLVYLVAWN